MPTIIDKGQVLGEDLNTSSKLIVDSANEILTNLLSAGYLSGGALTDNLDGTVDIDAGAGYIRQNSGDTDTLQYITWLASPGLTMVDGDSTYIYVDYNSGTPQIAITTTGSTIRDNENDKFELYEVVREGTELHITAHRQYANNAITKMQQRFYSVSKVTYAASEGGLALGETGTRNVTVTAGKLWLKLDESLIAAIDTSGSDTFDRYYRDSPSGFIKQSAQTQWDNANYDDGSGSLAPLTANRYTVQYFYVETDGALVCMYGQAQYTTLAGAEGDSPPSSVPKRIEDHAILIGRMIIQEGQATATSIESALGTFFAGAQVTDHGALSGLADDDHTQYLLLAGRAGQTITDSVALSVDITDTVANNVSDAINFSHLLSVGPAVNDIGIGIPWLVPSATGVLREALRINAVLTDVSNENEFGKVTLSTISDGAPLDFVSLIAQEDNNRFEVLQKLTVDLIENRSSDITLQRVTSGVIDSSISASTVGLSASAKGSAADVPAYMFNQNSRLGSSSNGFGYGFKNRGRNGSGVIKDIGVIDNVYTDVTNGFEGTKWDFKVLSNGAEVIPLSLVERDAIGGRGDLEGFAVEYSSTTAVAIKLGHVRAKDKYFILETDTTHTMTSLATGFDIHYIYIDDSASTTPIAVIIDSTTEPTYSTDNRGWYNGDDLCVGAVISPAGSATVAYFSTIYNAKEVTYHYGRGSFPQIANSMDPDSTWQTPNVTQSSVVVPVNATAIKVYMRAQDIGANCSARATSKEMASVNTTITDGDIDFGGYQFLDDNGWVILGFSRDIEIAGTNDDDISLGCECMGFKISRWEKKL